MGPGRHLRLRAILFLAVAAGSTTVALVAYGIDFFEDFERQTVDARFAVRGDREAPAGIVLVEVDDDTFSDLQERWPFPRSLHARLLDRIGAGQPRVVAFDVQFTEPSEVEEDNTLIEAAERHRGRIAFSTTEVDDRGGTSIFGGDGVLRDIGARPGNANFARDRGGTIRKMPYEVEGLKAFSVVAAEIALGRKISRSEMGGGETQWIDYAGRPGTVLTHSYSKVMRGEVPARVFRDKVVVIGLSAPSLQDIHATPVGEAMSGPELQANAIETALRGFPLRDSSGAVEVLLIVIFGLVPPFVGLRGTPLISIASGLLLAALFVVGTQMAFERGRVVSFVYPLTALTLSAVGSLGAHYLIAAFERERVRDVFSRFVPEQVVDQVLRQTDADLRLGGREVVTTIMFSDLRGFTTASETQGAEQVVFVLNHYLSEMSEAILAHGGTLVSYMGDGIMAVFGAPIEQDAHADRALAAARDMLCERLPRFNAWMAEQGLGQGFQMGIGLNSGPVAVGNVGHERRMEYTAIGDVTNTASRIEGMTKGTPFSLFVAESTYRLLEEPPPDLVYHDELEVRGRVAKLKLWALDVRKDEPPAAEAAKPQAG